MKDPCNYTLCYYKPSPQGFWFLRLGMVFSCFFNLIFFLACQDFGLHVGLRPHPSHFQKRCYVATCLRVQTGLKIKTKILCPWNYLYRVPYSGDNENISRCRDEHRSVPPESSVIDYPEKQETRTQSSLSDLPGPTGEVHHLYQSESANNPRGNILDTNVIVQCDLSP